MRDVGIGTRGLATKSVTKMQNILFLDIDGTIVEEGGYLPESAAYAIRKTRENGNFVCINTGRTSGNVDAYIREIGFDGYSFGCGTEIEWRGKTIAHTSQTPECSREIVSLVRQTNASVLYECRDWIYIDPETRTLPGLAALMETYTKKKTPFFPVLDDNTWYFDKFVIWYDDKTDLAAFQAGIAGKFDFIDRGNCFAEMVPCGCSKADGVQTLIQCISLENPVDPTQRRTFAVGDSFNDLPMFQATDSGIAMGDNPALFPYADYVTENLRDDGLAKAFSHFQLI